MEPPCAGGYPTEIAGCMQCAQEALAQGICAADKGGAAMGSTGAGWGTMWARPHFPPVSPGGRARTCRLKSGGTAKVTASTGEATILLRKAMYFRRTVPIVNPYRALPCGALPRGFGTVDIDFAATLAARSSGRSHLG